MIDSALPALRASLLAWYDVNRRDLPWRAVGDAPPAPYPVWLSEVMLQQTRVDTVRPYFRRWIERYPTLHSVAEAPLDDLLKAWEGLGYYSRVRNFHQATREVRERYGGVLPSDPAAFRSLPGVGRYTAGAVMSIAFGREEPAVDGNVRRVLARWLDDPEPRDAELWELARRLVHGERPGCFNQALMELGATVCTPRSPRCGECPVEGACGARASGTQQERPLPKRRGPLPHEQRVAVIVRRRGDLLLARSPLEGRLGGLWEFPGGKMVGAESARIAAERVLAEALGISVASSEAIAVVDHTFTHVRVSYHAVRAVLVDGTPRPLAYPEIRWVDPGELRALALPRAQQRIAALAE